VNPTEAQAAAEPSASPELQFGGVLLTQCAIPGARSVPWPVVVQCLLVPQAGADVRAVAHAAFWFVVAPVFAQLLDVDGKLQPLVS
jgi:hypothetical protein